MTSQRFIHSYMFYSNKKLTKMYRDRYYVNALRENEYHIFKTKIFVPETLVPKNFEED